MECYRTRVPDFGCQSRSVSSQAYSRWIRNDSEMMAHPPRERHDDKVKTNRERGKENKPSKGPFLHTPQ